MNSDFKDLLRLFSEAGVRYLVVGGMAFIFHAEPRYTKDLDLWVCPDPDNANLVYAALRQFGAPLANVTAQDFANSELFYQMGRPPARIDILMSIPGLDFEAAWSRRVETTVNDVKMLFVSREDLLASKLAAGRPQDLQDARTLQLRVRSPEEFS
jgi:hypothetical protein